MEWSPVSGNFSIQSFSDEGASLDLCFSFLDLCHDAINILQLLATFPENFGIFQNFILSFALNLLWDVVDVVPAVLLVQADELVEVALAPAGKSLAKKRIRIGFISL